MLLILVVIFLWLYSCGYPHVSFRSLLYPILGARRFSSSAYPSRLTKRKGCTPADCMFCKRHEVLDHGRRAAWINMMQRLNGTCALRSFERSESQGLDGGHHRLRIVLPNRLIGIHVELDLISIRILQVETLAHRVIAHALNRDAGLLQVPLRRA